MGHMHSSGWDSGRGGGRVVGGLKGMYGWGLTSAHDTIGVCGSGCVSKIFPIKFWPELPTPGSFATLFT